MSADPDDPMSFQDLIERSSLGTPEAQALRASISNSSAARAVARADEIASGLPTCCGLPLDDDGRCKHRPWHEQLPLKVVETPAEKLRRVAGLEEASREDLWQAIASAVIDINERMAVLEADADARRQVIAALQRRASAPLKGGTT